MDISTQLTVDEAILVVRSHRIILDSDLATLYGVSTKQLNQQIRRNRHRFPSDFMFRLTISEKNNLVTICDRFNYFKHLAMPPFAFTEHGTLMAANVLNSSKSIEMSVFIVRAFVRMRQLTIENTEIIQRIDDLESKCDAQFKVVFDTFRKLITPPDPPRRVIGF